MEGDVTPVEVSELLARSAIELIDVREQDEDAHARIAGGRLIELGRLAEQAATIPADRPVVLYCHSGGRSAAATSALRAAGLPLEGTAVSP